MVNLTFSNINISEDPLDIAAFTVSRYEGIQRLKEKELYLFTDLTTGSTYSFFPEQVTTEFIDNYLKEKRKEFDKYAWQIQGIPTLTEDIRKKHTGDMAVFLMYKNRRDEENGWEIFSATIEPVVETILSFSDYDLLSTRQSYEDAKDYAEEVVRGFESTDKHYLYYVNGHEEEYLELQKESKLSWKIQATPIDMKDAEVRDIIVWKT